MEENKTDALLKMLNITTDILKKNPTMDINDQQECLKIIKNIIEQLNCDTDLSSEQIHFVDSILNRMDALKPLSYMYVQTVPFLYIRVG